jgi:hypothetical protein
MWLGCVAIGAGCPANGGDVPMGESGDEQASSSDGGPSDDSGLPTDDDIGCPSDVDLFTTAPKSEAIEALDEDTVDPRFDDSFCASYCPDPPDDYLPSYCAPVDVDDVLPSDGSTDTTDAGTGADTSGGSESSESSSGSSSSSSDSGGADDELIDVRCHYWPGCM